MNKTFPLSDGHIAIRPPHTRDALAIYTAVHESLADLQPWMDWATPEYRQAATRHWLEHAQLAWQHASSFLFVITDATDNQYLGNCAIDGIDAKNHSANLSYWVRSSRTGQGIASRAARLCAQFAFQTAGLTRIEIVIAADNLASQRVAQKAGAHYQGILPKRMLVRNAEYDAVLYLLSPSDLQ